MERGAGSGGRQKFKINEILIVSEPLKYLASIGQRKEKPLRVNKQNKKREDVFI